MNVKKLIRLVREATVGDGALPDKGSMPVPFRVKEVHVTLSPEEERAVTYARQHNSDAPVQIVSLDTLCATQHTVETERVNTFLQNPDVTPRFPVVAQYQGELIIADGHHRLTALKLQGQQTAKAHVVSVDESRLSEDAAVNCAGGGAIAGLGVGPKGEPGFKIRKRNLEDIIGEEVKPDDQFAGADVFEVETGTFMKSRFGKNRYHRYSKYVGEDEKGETIRQHGRSTTRDIMLKDSRTGAMIYLRRKKPLA